MRQQREGAEAGEINDAGQTAAATPAASWMAVEADGAAELEAAAATAAAAAAAAAKGGVDGRN